MHSILIHKLWLKVLRPDARNLRIIVEFLVAYDWLLKMYDIRPLLTNLGQRLYNK